MLVLTRRKRESVVIADEIRITVEDIGGHDGEKLRGAKVRLGFQAPRNLSIHRQDPSRPTARGRANCGGRPVTPPKGEALPISDAQVRLCIEIPHRIPLSLNSRPIPAEEADGPTDRSSETAASVYHITFRQHDRLTICNNITVVAVDFYQYVFHQPSGHRQSEAAVHAVAE